MPMTFTLGAAPKWIQVSKQTGDVRVVESSLPKFDQGQGKMIPVEMFLSNFRSDSAVLNCLIDVLRPDSYGDNTLLTWTQQLAQQVSSVSPETLRFLLREIMAPVYDFAAAKPREGIIFGLWVEVVSKATALARAFSVAHALPWTHGLLVEMGFSEGVDIRNVLRVLGIRPEQGAAVHIGPRSFRFSMKSEERLDWFNVIRVVRYLRAEERAELRKLNGFSQEEVDRLTAIFNQCAYKKVVVTDDGNKELQSSTLRPEVFLSLLDNDYAPALFHGADLRDVKERLVAAFPRALGAVDAGRASAERLQDKTGMDLEAFLQMMNHVHEDADLRYHRKLQRAEENCGFSAQEVREFRTIFVKWDTREVGVLPFDQLVEIAGGLKAWRVPGRIARLQLAPRGGFTNASLAELSEAAAGPRLGGASRAAGVQELDLAKVVPAGSLAPGCWSLPPRNTLRRDVPEFVPLFFNSAVGPPADGVQLSTSEESIVQQRHESSDQSAANVADAKPEIKTAVQFRAAALETFDTKPFNDGDHVDLQSDFVVAFRSLATSFDRDGLQLQRLQVSALATSEGVEPPVATARSMAAAGSQSTQATQYGAEL
ncbi:unnamed protein product [Prorocentrum cordatum]|uniref:Calmodulin n=1 Tax=Prorocentrum cordatum TaxID=2364126 RepID=A0ABN9QXC0_9DINO|nr:unnamed protein product [Polarella glacialis]